MLIIKDKTELMTCMVFLFFLSNSHLCPKYAKCHVISKVIQNTILRIINQSTQENTMEEMRNAETKLENLPKYLGMFNLA